MIRQAVYTEHLTTPFMVTRYICISLFSFLLLSSAPLRAQVVSPVQSGHYTPANINIRDMAQPPAGLFALWYNAFVNSDKYIDRNGNEFNAIRLSEINSALPDIDVKVDLSTYAGIPAVYWASHFKILGGARYMAGVVPSIVDADASIVTERGVGVIDTTITRTVSGKVTGWSDLYVAPLGLSWGFEKYDVTTFYGFYAPTGRYEAGASDNVGLGFWTHQLQAYGYFYPRPDKSTAIMLGLTFEFNGKVENSDVTPGSRFSLDWGVSQYLAEKFDIGVQGGHNFQIGDDSGSDVYWDASIHDRKNTLAFAAGFWPFPDWLYVTGRYGFDYGVKQRFKNETWSINLIFMTHALAGKS